MLNNLIEYLPWAVAVFCFGCFVLFLLGAFSSIVAARAAAFNKREEELTFEEYLLEVQKYYNKHEHTLRQGQSAMNVLAKYRFGFYKAIMGTDADPFYQDSRLTKFYVEVARMWANNK